MPIDLSIVTAEIELDLDNIPRSRISEAKRNVGEIIVSEIKSHLNRSVSPVKGAPFKKIKADKTRSRLFQEGDLWSSIESRDAGGNLIEVGVFDGNETPKAYNHNVGDTLPVRRFIPFEGEEFKMSIQRKIDRELDLHRDSAQEEDEDTVASIGDILDALKTLRLVRDDGES